MPEVIDLAEHAAAKKQAAQDFAGEARFSQLSPEEQEGLKALAEEYSIAADTAAPPAMRVVTAFLVYIEPDGTTKANSDITIPVVPDREATMDDMYSAAGIIRRDVEATASAGATMSAMISVQQQMAQQAEAQNIAKLLPRDLKTNPNPNGPRRRR